MNMKSPSEIVDYLLGVSIEKGNKSIYKLSLLGFLAGMFIALGAVGSIISSSTLAKTNAGLGKLVAGAVFPVGLIMVVLLGVELFTSNCMLVIATINKSITIKQLFKNWIFVYFFNFLGGIFIAYITIQTHNFNEDSLLYLEKLATYKINTSAYNLFLKGILCNVLVCGAVLLTYSAKDVIGKIFAAWFPIMLFIILGYDHCVANMLYLSAAKIAGMEISNMGIVYNLFFATLGNIIGGILISLPLYLCYYKKPTTSAN